MNDAVATKRGFREELAAVLEDPSRDSFRNLLRDHTGEAANLDFKAEWPADEKLARHVLALGNSGGGCIVIGVAERPDKSLDPAGLTEFKDKVDVTKKVNPLIPDTLMRNLHIDDFAYETSDYQALQGKRFQLVSVLPDPEHLPYVAERANGDARAAAIYVRRGTESVEASHEELQHIINARIATGHSTAAAMKLEDHLDQLQVLNDRIPKTLVVRRMGVADLATQLQNLSGLSLFGGSNRSPNPDYPKEDTQAFIRKMFEAKKARIKRDLDVE
ncbi:ATP-binding protein [Sphingomonas sp. ABOLH]|uniref:AlbA family DNA-binding domain-containing protein n=1 Tax=Sphingomonas sp. ABOLH TaxID=1985881 RepID=UPI000F7E8300|nr:ATP-binding protein [Sphingomonas sp. ABOLH]RSV33120.1 ATP-binding protein [Sphingomonas sp. ABOLH]